MFCLGGDRIATVSDLSSLGLRQGLAAYAEAMLAVSQARRKPAMSQRKV